MKRAQMFEYIDQFVAEANEPPSLVGVHNQSALVVQQPVVEIDDALHEGGGKCSDAAVVEQVDAAGLWQRRASIAGRRRETE